MTEGSGGGRVPGEGRWFSGGRYEGEFSEDGKPHGKGVYTWPAGTRYEGEFRDGYAHGQGVRTWADGGRYEGEFREGEFHGQGVHTWPAGARYEGEWRDSVPHGQGIATFPDGTHYEGGFVDGAPHGQGVRTHPDGTRQEGEFREGEFQVNKVLLEVVMDDAKTEGALPDGPRYEGGSRDGRPHGRGRYTWPDGTYIEGEFRDGEMVGEADMFLREPVDEAAVSEGDDWKGRLVVKPDEPFVVGLSRMGSSDMEKMSCAGACLAFRLIDSEGADVWNEEDDTLTAERLRASLLGILVLDPGSDRAPFEVCLSMSGVKELRALLARLEAAMKSNVGKVPGEKKRKWPWSGWRRAR